MESHNIVVGARSVFCGSILRVYEYISCCSEMNPFIFIEKEFSRRKFCVCDLLNGFIAFLLVLNS